MSAYPNQTKDTIRRLRAAGLKRSEFRVRCERRNGGYFLPDVTLFCERARCAELVQPLLAQEFGVERFLDHDGNLLHLTVLTAPSERGMVLDHVVM